MIEKKLDIPQIINYPAFGESSLGYITHAEHPKNMPFRIERVYWTYYTPQDVERGYHAHVELKQIIFALSGKIEFHIEDVFTQKYLFVLDKPTQGLFLPPMHWRKIKFSHNAILLCLASLPFSEGDYIRSYDEFKKLQSKYKIHGS